MIQRGVGEVSWAQATAKLDIKTSVMQAYRPVKTLELDLPWLVNLLQQDVCQPSTTPWQDFCEAK